MRTRNLIAQLKTTHLVGLCLVAAVAAHPRADAGARSSPEDLVVSASRLSFYAKQDGSTPVGSLVRSFTLRNVGATTINWTIVPSDPWIVLDRRIGSVDPGATTTVSVGADITNAAAGPQSGTLTIWDADTVQALHTVAAFLRVCAGTCVSLDAGDQGRTISPLLFGSQIDWLSSGSYLWSRPVSTTCHAGLENGYVAPTTLDRLRALGLGVLRYPGGISADFLAWNHAVGPMASRLPQIDAYKRSLLFGADIRECPVFGPDEFGFVANQLGTELLAVANVGTGTPQMAAGWAAHYQGRGVRAQYWEIGNEIYLPGTPLEDPAGTPFAFAAAYKPPDVYAAAFDEYARVLRAVDPAAKVGAVVDPDGGDWNNVPGASWNELALARITERADFIATHLLFPRDCTVLLPKEFVYRNLLAAPALQAFRLERLKATLARVAGDANKNASIAVTEHGAFFWCGDFGRNRTLASALYSAMNFHLFFREPRIVLATHSNLTHPLYQAALTTSRYGAPITSAFYHVFRAYAQAAGGTVTGTSVLGAPTFSSEGLGTFPPQTDLAVLDSTAVTGPGEGTLRLYVVNRSLREAVTARVALDGLTGPIASISLATVNGFNYDSDNSAFFPNAVTTVTRALAPAAEFDFTFPAHSLSVLTILAAR